MAEDVDYSDAITRCICDFEHDDGFMISCDKCTVWQHCVCMEINQSNEPDNYYCEQCHPREVNRSKAKKIQNNFLKKINNSGTCSAKIINKKSTDERLSNSSFGICNTALFESYFSRRPNITYPLAKKSKSTNTHVLNKPEDTTSSSANVPTSNKKDLNVTTTDSFKDIGIFPYSLSTIETKVNDKRDIKVCGLCNNSDDFLDVMLTNQIKRNFKSDHRISFNYAPLMITDIKELPFSEGENVYVFDGIWIYSAVIVHIHSDDQHKVWYRIHFDGYPEDDMCVTSERLLKINENSTYMKSKIETLSSSSKYPDPKCITLSSDQKKIDLKEKEDVIVFYNGYLYNGQIIGLQVSKDIESSTLYHIHYNGWPKKWDEWVIHDRIFKNDASNREIRDKLELFRNNSSVPSKKALVVNSTAIHVDCEVARRKIQLKGNEDVKGLTCKCNRWIHLACSGLREPVDNFTCKLVDLKCQSKKRKKSLV